MYRLIHRYRLTVLLLGLMLFVLLVVGLAPVSLNAGPQDSDRFVAVAGGDIASSLDPAMNYDNEAIIQIYETLLWFDKETNAYVPRVAAHWEVTNSGKDFIFHIRNNIKFHDGSLLQAHDIAYSIQRGMLQSDAWGHQYLLIQPIMGYGSGDITEEINGGPFYGDRADLLANGDPNEMRMTCEKAKQHVSADDDAGTVTIHTEQGDASFLTALATFGFILDEEWTKAQGDWDGSCDTWQNYYGPNSTEAGSLLDQKANGSGPFKHTDWTQGVEMILQRHDNYWAGPAALREISYKVVEDENTRLQMLLNGQADRAALSTLEPPADKVRLEYSGDDLTLVNEIGVLKSYTGEPRPIAADLFFTFAIETAVGNPYIGSGQLDGNGIPPDFFDNIHARKAFSYAFDYEAYNNQSFNGRAVRRTGPIAPNLMGYSPLQPTYDYDPAKAKQEFMQVLGDKGFRMTIVYNTNNSSRETAAKILEQGIEALDPKYQIDVVGIANSDMLKEWGDGKLPVAFGGWWEDYHHPNNWLEPWLFGGYANWARIPQNLQDKYRADTAACTNMTGAAQRACYESIQQDAYERALQLYLLQDTTVQYVRAEVRGYGQTTRYHSYPYLYPVSKGMMPFVSPWNPGLVYDANFYAGNKMVKLIFPDTSFSADTDILIEESSDVRGKQTEGFFVTEDAFSMTAFDNTGKELPSSAWGTALPVTVGAQTPTNVGELGDSLLLHWTGDAWEDGSCGEYVYLDGGAFSTFICAPGLYAVGEKTALVYMPVVLGK